MRIQCYDRCEGQATVQFSIDGHPDSGDSISGQLRGPFCQHSRTLPSNYRIEKGESVVVDPCFWTPKLPFLYEIQLSYETENGTQNHEFQFGIRWCITNRSGIRLNGKSHVVRAISANGEVDLKQIRSLSAGLILPKYSAAVCQQASELGVMVVCLDMLNAEQADEAQRFPAVHFARSSVSLSTDIFKLVDGDVFPGTICLTDESELIAGKGYAVQSPRFIVRRSSATELADLRSECDRLQRDVASFGQFAGYLIDSNS